MPELPEVETVRIALKKEILNEKILSVQILNKNLRYPIECNFSNKVVNQRIKKITRRGKYLILFLTKNITILLHLGMTGYFRFSSNVKLIKHDHVIFSFKEKKMIYNDVRKFGFIKVYKSENINHSKHLAKLGLEPLDKELNKNYLSKSIKSSKQSIKAYLMNFKNIVGIGNIYSSEILFDSAIHPFRLSSALSNQEIERLIISIKKILRKAIKLGGTSIKNYKDPMGKIGYFKNQLKVYARDNKPCVKCRKNVTIKKIIIQGRSTFFCEICQKF